MKPPSIAPAAPVAEVADAEAAVAPVPSVEPSAAPTEHDAATQSAEPHLPPSRARVVAALPSVMVDDAHKATASSIRGKKKRQWM